MSSHLPEKKNQISRVIILELFTGKVGSSLILMENRRELFQNITGTSTPHLTPICGSSGFIKGIVKRADGRVERGRGIMQDLIDIEGVRPENIDKEQFYLQIDGGTT